MTTSRRLLWVLRAAWLALAVTAGPVLAAGLEDRSGPVTTVGAAGSWVAWGGVLVALLVPATSSLTVLRILAPTAPAAAAAALVAGEGVPAWQGALALATTLGVALVAFSPPIGRAFVQGSAYGDETRFPLRAPGALLLGPIQLTWALVVGPLAVGALLVAAGRWAGLVGVAAGAALAVLGTRRLHRLSRRWLVFVPAGVVLHDHLALTEPVLVRRSALATLRAAPADTDATDCTARAPGLALELRLAEPTPIVLAGDLQHRQGRPVVTAALLCTPSQPGAVLDEARRRGLRTG